MKIESETTELINGSSFQPRRQEPDGRVQLQPKIEALLKVLARDVGKTVSRQQLIDEIWGGDPNCNDALTVAVCSLRRHLHDNSLHPQFIETVRNYGYRLITPVDAYDVHPTQPPAFSVVDSGDSETEASAKSNRHPFMADLIRRRVFRVLTLYMIISWIVLQVGEVTFEPLGVPAWCLTLLVLLVGLGFPVAAVLAWALQVTPSGVVLDITKEQKTQASYATASRQLHVLIIASLVCAVIAMGFRLFQLERLNAQIVSTKVTNEGSESSLGVDSLIVSDPETQRHSGR